MACEVSIKDYNFLKWLPQYLFWKDASLIDGLLMSGVDSDKLKWAC